MSSKFLYLLRVDDKFRHSVILSITKIFTFFITGALLAIIFRSTYSPNPLLPTDSVVYVKAHEGVNILIETRGYKGLADETVTVSRYLYPEGDSAHAIQLEGGIINVKAGENSSVLKTALLPTSIYGLWCSNVTYSWWPSYSQKEFFFETADLCFEVPRTKNEE